MGKLRTWTDDDLRKAVKENYSIYGTLKAMGLCIGGGTMQSINNKIKELDIDKSHFTGRAWNKGKKIASTINLDKILVENSTYINTNRLRLRLISCGLKEFKCEQCNLSKWNNKPISLELHHLDGERSNNKIENLQILCPNCHAQTDTYCSKNKKGNVA